MSALEERAEALRALAGLLRAGLGPHEALREWHRDVPATCRPALMRMARRISLGSSPSRSVAELGTVLGDDAPAVAAAFSVHMELGGDVAHVFDRLAAAVERRAASERAARAASAGALLSGRVVAGLPLFLVPLAPLAKAPLLDSLGIAMVVVGVGLALAGMWWIGHLDPRPPSADDPAALLADLLASAARGGVPLAVAMESAARVPLARLAHGLSRARRRGGARRSPGYARGGRPRGSRRSLSGDCDSPLRGSSQTGAGVDGPSALFLRIASIRRPWAGSLSPHDGHGSLNASTCRPVMGGCADENPDHCSRRCHVHLAPGVRWRRWAGRRGC